MVIGLKIVAGLEVRLVEVYQQWVLVQNNLADDTDDSTKTGVTCLDLVRDLGVLGEVDGVVVEGLEMAETMSMEEVRLGQER